MSDISHKEAAAYLLKLKRAGMSFPGFMDYYYPQFTWEPFHREMQEILDLLEKDALVSPGGNPVRNLLINMPPRHAKSFNATVAFPAYALMRKPHRELMVSAYNNDLATTFGRGTREIVADSKARKAFKGFELSRETRAVDFWKTTVGGAYYAVGLDGTTTGRGSNGLFVDDPYKSREEADSIAKRRTIWNFYTSGLLARRQPDRDNQPSFQVVTHTRWHPDDMAGRIMESDEFKRGEWHHLNFQALTKKERPVYVSRATLPKDDPRHVPEIRIAQVEEGKEDEREQLIRDNNNSDQVVDDSQVQQALWPGRFDVPWLLQQKRVLGDRDFEALYQQNPYVAGGNLLKEKWLRKYRPDELPEFHAIAIGVDTAFKAKKRNDYSVFTVGGITEIGDIYILKVYRDKWEFPDLKRQCIVINSIWRGKGLRGFWVEDAASGQSLIQELREGTGVPVIPWRSLSQDKFARAAMVSPIIESGRVFVPEEAEWLDDWLQELVTFPSSKNDDQVDSLVITLDTLSRMVVVGLKEFYQPIGQSLSQDMQAELLFAGQPLKADPLGWLGKAGFGGSLQDVQWKGWGQ